LNAVEMQKAKNEKELESRRENLEGVLVDVDMYLWIYIHIDDLHMFYDAR